MNFKSLLISMLAVSFAFAACEETPETPDGPDGPDTPNTSDLPTFDFPFVEEFPVEAGNLIAEGSEVGVTIEVTKVEDNNFVFELRPGAMVQSYKLDVYPMANLYNTFLNVRNAGNLTAGDPIAINDLIRNMIFTDGSGGYAFSVLDSENPEDFLQKEFDWMNTPYAAASAIAIPDADFLIAVVSSTDPDISSANQEELTLCFVHTTSQPLVGDPQVEIEVRTGYRAFGVQHHPNSDAAGIYYFGSLATEIDEYIDTFGDELFRDFMRTLYSAPIMADDENGLSYTKSYGMDEVDHTVKSATCAVAVDMNMTPQEGYARRDFTLDAMPDEGEQELADPKINILPEKVAAAYVEFEVVIPKVCNTIFWAYYTEEEKLAWEAESDRNKRKEAIRLVNEGYGKHNPNFAWNKDAPEGEEATGTSATVRIEEFGFAPGSTVYIGMTGRNGYGTAGPLIFSDPIKHDDRNFTSPDNCKVKDLVLDLTDATRTSFTQNVTYDPETVSAIHFQWIPEMVNISRDSNVEDWRPWREYYGIDENSAWSEWIDVIFGVEGAYSEFSEMLNVNSWPVNKSGSDPWVWTGMEPSVEYTVFLCAEDYDGNISQMLFDKIVTKDVQVGPDPTVNMALVETEEGHSVVYTMDHDVEYFKYCIADSVVDLNIAGANQGSLNNIAGSGIDYETWKNAIYNWVFTLGLETHYESVSQEVTPDKVCIAAALGFGRDADGNPCYKMSHLIIKDGKAQTLEEIFGITE